MKSHVRLGLLATLVLLCPLQSRAQNKPSAAETVENLKLQLLDVKAREDDLRLRVQQLDENLKPENIERALAGVGSTKPEELREQRRRQLTVEKTGAVAQLEELAALLTFGGCPCCGRDRGLSAKCEGKHRHTKSNVGKSVSDGLYLAAARSSGRRRRDRSIRHSGSQATSICRKKMTTEELVPQP